MIKDLHLLLPIVFAAAILGAPTLAAEKPLKFTPQNGFSGDSEGNGTLTWMFGEPRSFHVESRGWAQADGAFRLEQSIQFQGEQPATRAWVITQLRPNHYSATLTDASGPVTAVTAGRLLSLRYRVKGPLFVKQELTLSPDGSTIDNVGVISLFGFPVGHLKETIVRKGRALHPMIRSR